MDCGIDEVFCNEGCEERACSCVGFILFSSKPETLLKGAALVAYLLHVVLLNVFVSHRRWIIENGHMLAGFWCLSRKKRQRDDEESDVRWDTSRHWFSAAKSIEREAGNHRRK